MSAHQSRLSSADAAWLHMDRPTNLMVINSILLFDEELDWERLTKIVGDRLVAPYPRFRQRVIEGGPLLGAAHWQDDPDFELARHMHRRGLPAPADMEALRSLAGDLASMPLDREKPLWEMYLIDGPGEGSAVIVRMHHCIADGIALASVMLSLTDSAPEEVPGVGAAPRSGSARPGIRGTVGEVVAAALSPALGAASTGARVGGVVAREGMRVLAHPPRAIELLGGLNADGRALGKLLFTSADQDSALRGELGVARAVAWSRPLSLARVKDVAHAQGATVNDVLLGAVSGALRGYLSARGEEPHAIRALVPVNLRAEQAPAPDELGNRFGLVFLTLPVDLPNRRERLHELKRRMDEIKDSPEGLVSYAVLEGVGLTPPQLESRIVDIFTAKATAVMTNVPGPREAVYLAGSPLRTVLVWAPTAGSVGMSVSIFSYNGEITVGLLVHEHLVPDSEAILERLHGELAAMARLKPAVKGRVG